MTAEIELFCPLCQIRLPATPDTLAAEIIERMNHEGHQFTLGNGATFEEMVFAALLHHGAINCPDCCRPVLVREKSLGWWLDARNRPDEERELADV